MGNVINPTVRNYRRVRRSVFKERTAGIPGIRITYSDRAVCCNRSEINAFWQRAFSISDKKIGRAFSLGAVLFAVVPLSMGILGFIAAGIGFMPKDTGMVNFELIQALFLHG